jgi:hypothetical protein
MRPNTPASMKLGSRTNTAPDRPAMIDPKRLLSALQKRVRQLEEDLRARCDGNADVDRTLRVEYEAAKKKGRTALTYSAWRDGELTQVAAAWVLACVFVRFLEDNELIETPYLAGPGSRLQRAKDEHEIFFRTHPTLTEREYLERVFTEVGTLPAMKEFFDRKYNPLWQVAPSGDAAKELLDLWRKTDPDTGALIYDFTDPEWNTRFLGDLYQDLSEAAQKKFALLQTPNFVEEFILDRTLTPAIQTFGYQVVRMIDPACGSGHFLLDGFQRLFRLWQEHQPGENPRVLAQKALDGIYGVDLNPYAVAIARFRLLLIALKVCSVRRLRGAPDFQIHAAVGDSLLHGRRFREFDSDQDGPQRTFDTEEIFRDELKHHYEVEDIESLHRILGRPYHAVVGNPPYITVKDRALSELYRARYTSCHRQYSLSVPFMERFFDLAIKGDGTPQQPAGFVGQITANSFMKREFGKKLIEEFLPRWDLTHVLDTSGAYIPGHGTPTVILLGRNQLPVRDTIRTVLGIRGEPTTPVDSAQGLVWKAICTQIDRPGNKSEWVSTTDSPRANFHRHPWSIGGGGAAELQNTITESAASTVGAESEWPIGRAVRIGEEDAFIFTESRLHHSRVDEAQFRGYLIGENVRDWSSSFDNWVWYPYCDASRGSDMIRQLWPWRTSLKHRMTFQGKMFETGVDWFAYQQHTASAYTRPLSIAFAFVATHNHFVFDSGGRVFNRSAPIIKLRAEATVQHYVRLLSVLNSSTACFWMKQVFFPKGGDQVGRQGARVRKTMWDERYEFDATKLANFPIPARLPEQLSTALIECSAALQANSPAATLKHWSANGGELRKDLASARELCAAHRRKLIAWQEELDWQIYEAFGLVDSADGVSLPEGKGLDMISDFELELGERAFEIVLARRMAAGELQSTWFERHASMPITELPRHWPVAYRELVERRIRRIESDPNIRLIEQPEYKRRWNTEPWNEQLTLALSEWLLNRLEGYFFEGNRMCALINGFCPAGHGFIAATRPHLVTANRLAEVVNSDTKFLEVAELYYGSTGFSVPKMVRELIEDESVPFLPVHRYKDSGLRARKDWEATWEVQRKEDAVEAEVRKRHPKEQEERLKDLIRKAQQEQVGDVPVPPKYASKDFQKGTFWKLRGKLDVPKERWISYPGAERDGDPSPLIAWAGWDHLQQAQALAEYYLDAKGNQGWSAKKLKMLLAGLLDLLPWIKQWHNETDPDYGMGLGDYFAGFLEEECRALGLTMEAVNEARYFTAPAA